MNIETYCDFRILPTILCLQHCGYGLLLVERNKQTHRLLRLKIMKTESPFTATAPIKCEIKEEIEDDIGGFIS